MTDPSGFLELLSELERRLDAVGSIGTQSDPKMERIILRHDPSLASPTGEVTDVTVQPDGVVEVTTALLGITGSNSPIPTFMAEGVALEDPDAPTQRQFLDLFHHRLLSLLFRLLRHYNGEQTCAWLLASHHSSMHLLPAEASYFPAELLPLLVGNNKGADVLRLGLEGSLRIRFTDVHVTVETMAGRWTKLDRGARCSLGRRNHRLGDDLCLGSKCPDPGGGVVIRIAGIPASAVVEFRPGQVLHQVAARWLGVAAEAPIRFSLVLEVQGQRQSALSETNTAVLGHSAWLATLDGSIAYTLEAGFSA